MRSSFRINRFKVVNKLLIILFSCIFLTNSEASENLEITLSYYIIRNIGIIKEIKLINETYTKKDKGTTSDEREDSKYENYANIFRILKSTKPIFSRTSKVRVRDKVFDFALVNDKELHVSYDTGIIKDDKMPLGINVRYANRILHTDSHLLVRFNKPFMLKQSRIYKDSNGLSYMKVLYLQVVLKGK